MLKISYILFMVSLISFSLKRYHLLLLLLSLEFIVLILYFNMLILYGMYYKYFMIIYMIISVCEGALGLSILVSMIRNNGNDYFQSLNILW